MILLFSGDPGVPLYGPSGASAHLRGVARALAERDALHIAVPRLSDHRGAVDDPLPDPTTTSAPRRWRWLGPFRERGEAWDGRRLLRGVPTRPSLIWERYSVFSDAGRRMARRLGISRVVELNAPLTQERPGIRDRRYAQRMERAQLSSADRVVAVSAWLAQWAVDQGCHPDRVRHVPNGSDVAPTERTGPAGLRLGFVGSLKPWHGLHHLPALLDALPEATLVIAGAGPTAIPAHPRIEALGRVAPRSLPQVLSTIDVGLAPYEPSGPAWFCPLKVADYRAAGVRVVATDIGDCAAQIGDGGEVLQSLAPQAWADAVRRQAARPRIAAPRPWATVVSEALQGLG